MRARFGLNEVWCTRLLACDRARIEQMQKKWARNNAARQKLEKEQEREEWAAWARTLAVEAGGKGAR
jgi:hypothetical protein